MSGLFNDDTLSLYLKLKEAMKQYVRDAMPGGALNAEVPNYPGLLAAQAKAQQNTLRDAWGDPNKMADATLGMMNGAMGSFLPFGITAWHGSPHKFDKFDLSKIGTGEGAQAYGHGLYLAESPEVAMQYRDSVGKTHAHVSRYLREGKSDAEIIKYIKTLDDVDTKTAKATLEQVKSSPSSLYKTDIPDEAVARFLDWDKPLSEQAPEVQDALAAIKAKQAESLEVERFYNPARALAYKLAKKPLPDEMSGESVYRFLGKNHQDATDLLRKQGIPGIRYLDGGSRGAGTGTSNFVVFDPEMIRILERNGQPTGLQPWSPGEWQGLLSGAK